MEAKRGLIHLYCGDGKGKTTAAMGLALRAVGHGFHVGVVQFLKDGDSGELTPLASLPGVRVLSGKGIKGFSFRMTEGEKEMVKQYHEKHLGEAIGWCREGWCDLLILDEVVDAVNSGLLSKEILLDFLQEKPPALEVALTGRNPEKELVDLADYYSEVRKIKHPYDRGITAREGIEK